ncbi:DUF5329 domain-containing protein [Chitinimonas sp.]|uniref:DUF5329 domain-containing protein n=1 Tax=Chitinimonas sp. TaxID=1934313 RepID=UPI0035B0FE2B
MRLPAFLLLILAASRLYAATPADASHHEIELLLTRLETSGCQFNRNGSWYQGGEAKSHLLRKLDYLDSHGGVRSTEQFIEQAASSSSSTGKPYWVKCGSAAPMQSGKWLTGELAHLRATNP